MCAATVLSIRSCRRLSPDSELDKKYVTQILDKCRVFCSWPVSTFPGAQPVSLSKSNLHLLARNPYVACEKTDGVRYLLYAALGQVFLIDRREDVFQCSLALPVVGAEDVTLPKNLHNRTLLDGELVEDRIPVGENNDEAKCMRYLIYDAMAINDRRVTEENLLERLARVYTELVIPRRIWLEQNPSRNSVEERESFEIYLKDFFEIRHLPAIIDISNRKILPHESDGVIFTPVRDPYKAGTCQGLLKWKPAHLNTVDFRIEIIEGGNAGCNIRLLVQAQGMNVPFSWLAPCGEKFEQMRQQCKAGNSPTGQIWECYRRRDVATFVPKRSSEYTDEGEWIQEGWVLERRREDKDMPNDIKTVRKVEQSIADGISVEELCKAFTQYQEHGKKDVASLCTTPQIILDHYKLPEELHLKPNEKNQTDALNEEEEDSFDVVIS